MNCCLFTIQANQDLNQIHDFIAQDKPKAALRFIDFIEEKCRVISQSPDMGRKRENLAQGLRSFPVGKYVIFYRSVSNGIHVIRILHGSCDIQPMSDDGS